MAPWRLTDSAPAEFLCQSLNPFVSFDVNIQHMATNKLLPAAPLIAKLESLGLLSPEAKNALFNLPHAIREIERHEVVLHEGDQPANIYLLVDGCVFRSTVTPSGGRQIMALHIPGAILNLQNLFLPQIDHPISTLVPTTVALIAHRDIQNLLEAHPMIALRILHQTFIETAISRKWLTSVGRRTAHGSIAHFISEFIVRMRAAGRCEGNTCDFPLTQTELGDALGLSTVHVNRTVKKLRQDGLISWHHHSLTVHDWDGLNRIADFDDAYLELRSPGARRATDT